MRDIANWRIARHPAIEVLRYDPQQVPPDEDLDGFIATAKFAHKLLPFQTSRYVLRSTDWAMAWLRAYVGCHIRDLAESFVREDKSFHIVFLEHPVTLDRSVAFRLTTVGVTGHTEWMISFRRVRFEDSDEFFLCAEY